MKNRKRIISWIILAICVVMLTGHAGNADTPATEAAAAEAAPFVPTALRYIPAPEEAFEGMSNSVHVAAAGEGGNKLLICWPDGITLWDVSAGKRMPVWFSREPDIELLNLIVWTKGISLERATDTQAELYRQKIADYLAAHGLTRFENFDQVTDFFGPDFRRLQARCTSAGDRYAVIQMDVFGMCFSVDMTTGEALLIEEYTVYDSTEKETTWAEKYDIRFTPVLYGDRLLSNDGITDLGTGETECPELTNSEDLPEDLECFTEMPCVLLPDGSIAELRSTKMKNIGDKINRVWSRNWYLLDRKAGRATGILLHEGDEDYSLRALYLTGNGKYAALYSPTRMMIQSPLIVNRETGEVRSPDGFLLIFVGSYDTGFICMDTDTRNMVRLDAETLSMTEIPFTGDNCPDMDLYTSSYLTGFGRIYCVQKGELHGYFLAEN